MAADDDAVTALGALGFEARRQSGHGICQRARKLFDIARRCEAHLGFDREREQPLALPPGLRLHPRHIAYETRGHGHEALSGESILCGSVCRRSLAADERRIDDEAAGAGDHDAFDAAALLPGLDE